MTTTPTLDVAATVAQCIALAEAGCEVIRITAQNVKAAEALGPIRKQFAAAGFGAVPLVADIHFLPQAAMEAAMHVEKVRINPGNYADKKKFAVREYSDALYQEELERLYEAFTPIVLRCKEYGRAMRIGTNHGSLSDRIMNRYGDTPLGMCESALEFLRIAESHGYHDIILSMKASNPKVMIQAYRLMVAMMAAEDMHYPLHLGVTEAGDGDDARIKSAVGIGSLLLDGLGDTIRVSLTEDPVAEIPVARALADKAMALWRTAATRTEPDAVDPYVYVRRPVAQERIAESVSIGPLEPPRVIQPIALPPAGGDIAAWREDLRQNCLALKDAKIEVGLVVVPSDPKEVGVLRAALADLVPAVIWDATGVAGSDAIRALEDGLAGYVETMRRGDCLLVMPEMETLPEWNGMATRLGMRLAYATGPELLARLQPHHLECAGKATMITLAQPETEDAQRDAVHTVGRYRQLAEVLDAMGCANPIWIRNTHAVAIDPDARHFGDRLLEASLLTGSLLCDGIGDFVSVETVDSLRQSVTLAYNLLQGARSRSVKTEYVACPSCGRTLFDLQSTTQRIRAATGHLKGVTIAVMGCIVNGPGEMADADFGYVGGSPGKVNLYVGKQCVQYHIPAERAVEALVELIREHGKWVDP